MSSTNQTSSPTDSPPIDGAGAGVEQFLGHNAAALIILFPFAILLLAALAKCCLAVSTPATENATRAGDLTKKHASTDWVTELPVDDGELGCSTCSVVEAGSKAVVGSVGDAALVDERVAAGYDGAYRGH
jgi:hypothetical protein